MTDGNGWLVEQLPRVMAEDPVLRGFVTALEEVAGTVRDRVDSIEHHVDTGLAARRCCSSSPAGSAWSSSPPTRRSTSARSSARSAGCSAGAAPGTASRPARGGHRLPGHGARRRRHLRRARPDAAGRPQGRGATRPHRPPQRAPGAPLPGGRTAARRAGRAGHPVPRRKLMSERSEVIGSGSRCARASAACVTRGARDAMADPRGLPVSCPDCGAPVYPQRDQLCAQCGYPLMFLRQRPGAGEPQFGVARAPGERDQPAPAAHPVLLQPVPPPHQPAPNEIGCPACHEINPATRIRCQRCGHELRPARPAALELPPMPKSRAQQGMDRRSGRGARGARWSVPRSRSGCSAGTATRSSPSRPSAPVALIAVPDRSSA